MYEAFGLFIDGAWRKATSGSTQPVYSPVTEQAVGEAPIASIGDTKAAIDASEAGFGIWAGMPCFERADALHAIADEMRRRSDEAVIMISTETGKPIAQAQREWSLSVDQFRWYAEEARRIYGRTIESRVSNGQFEVSRNPVGVSAAFTAWNFPAVLVARKVAPALAAGCAIIVRPSSQTPGAAMLMVDCCRALPAGTIQLVIGPTETTYAPLMTDKRVRKVSLTGSTRVGQQMIQDAAATVKKVSMELGGNAPLIVCDDADLELALNTSTQFKFANAGQVCIAPDRFFVHETLHDAFVEGITRRATALMMGDGLDSTTQMGPLISRRRLEEVVEVVDEAVAQGARIATGGRRAPGFNSGHFYEPTVVIDVTDGMRVMAHENFGPVAAITRFRDDDEVLERANSSDMGLAAYAFTRDPGRARYFASALRSGMVGINSFAVAAAEAPYGGTKFSGLGREGGNEGIDAYLEPKLVQVVF